MHVLFNSFHLVEWDMRKEQDDEEQQYRNEMKEKMMDAAFEPEAFGDPVSIYQKPHHTDQASLLISSVVSIALFNGDYSAICIRLSILLHSLPVNDLNHDHVQETCWYMHAPE
jgi:hypothetical protein